MDLGTILGLIFCVVAMVWAILMGSPLTTFIDVPSVILVGGGCICVVFVKWPVAQVSGMIKVLSKCFYVREPDLKGTIDEIQKLSETARRESIFALEKVPVEDPFMKKAISLAADNRPPEVVSSILQVEIGSMQERHAKGAEVLEALGNDAPAFGMLGTIIGLVQMLKNLSDPSAIGPAMAVALLTTFYGSIIANVFALPLMAKLKARSKQEMLNMNIILAGTLGIIAGENPRMIREKLESFLPPSLRSQIDDTGTSREIA